MYFKRIVKGSLKEFSIVFCSDCGDYCASSVYEAGCVMNCSYQGYKKVRED
jgi:hypothetical protein